MKLATSLSKSITALSLAGALSMTLVTSQAVASFIDYDHSAASVTESAAVYGGDSMKSASMDTGDSMKSNGFIDYDHSAESVSSGSTRSSSGSAPGNCGFLDCDHTLSNMKS